MINIEFSEEEIEELDRERFDYPDPRVQKRLHALYLKAMGISHSLIMVICGIKSRTTLASFFKVYQKGGIDALKKLNYQGPKSELDEHCNTLKEYFEQNPPRSVEEAADAIEELTGIRRSATQVRGFLKRLGMKYRRTGYAPGKESDEEKAKEQEEFLENELNPRLEEAKEGKREVLFVDAAHFVYGRFLASVWCFVRLLVPSACGRQRFNVLGGVSAISKRVITFTNESTINADSFCQFLEKVVKELGDGVPITIVLDNARYQRCQRVFEHAGKLGIELLYLPSYSPNLNLIERLWRYAKKECLYGKFHSTFEEFKAAIEDCIEQTQTTKKHKLLTLLTLKFQIFKNVQFLPV